MTAQTKKTKTAAPSIKLIPLDQLDANPHNPRDLPTVPESSPGLVALADSLAAVGVLQPLNVRPQTGKAKGRYMIIAGHRRALAARLAGLAAVPCYIDERKTAERQLVAPLAENLAREGLPALHIVEQIAKMKDDGHAGQKIAAAIGRSPAFVSKALRVARWLAEDPEAKPDPADGLDALYSAATMAERQEALAKRNAEAEQLEQQRREAADAAAEAHRARAALFNQPLWVDPIKDEQPEPDEDGDSRDQLPLTGIPAPQADAPESPADRVAGCLAKFLERHGDDFDAQCREVGDGNFELTVCATEYATVRLLLAMKIYLN